MASEMCFFDGCEFVPPFCRILSLQRFAFCERRLEIAGADLRLDSNVRDQCSDDVGGASPDKDF